jgi:hypothetical protein
MTRVGLILLILLLLASTSHAQDEIYVTTQDYSSLRLGPSTLFERITVLPPGTTLRAVGRTISAHWLQVEYEGGRGWIAARLLIWSGEWYNLPVDGVDPAPFARRSGQTITLTPGMRYFPIPGGRSALLDISEVREVEVTARFGSGEFVWLQFQNGALTGWVNVPNEFGVSILNLPDGTLLYPYGRVIGIIRRGLVRASTSYHAINDIWRQLDVDGSASCFDLPRYAPTVTFTSEDLAQIPTLVPSARAVEGGIAATNDAIRLFEDFCTGSTRVIERATIAQALAALGEAERQFIIANRLLNPLAALDPLLAGG